MNHDSKAVSPGFAGYGQRWKLLEQRISQECNVYDRYTDFSVYINEVPTFIRTEILYLLFHTESPAVYKDYSELYKLATNHPNVHCFTWLRSACSVANRVYFLPYNLIFPSEMLSTPKAADRNCMAILRPGSFRRLKSFWYRLSGLRSVGKLGITVDVYGTDWTKSKMAIWNLMSYFNTDINITGLPWELRNSTKEYTTRFIVENAPHSDYFSEKVIDAIINGFHVIYYSKHISISDHFLATLPWRKLQDNLFLLECSSETFHKLKTSMHNTEVGHSMIIERVNTGLQLR